MDKLTRNLVNSGLENFKYTREFIDAEHDGCDEKFELLTRKGVYPYSYIDEAVKFDEDLPPQHCFYNDMTDEALTDEDYAFSLTLTLLQQGEIDEVFPVIHCGDVSVKELSFSSCDILDNIVWIDLEFP